MILAFEVENRAYFSASVSDRGDDYFEHFTDRHDELLARQATGHYAYYVLVEPDGTVIGRFNLVEISDGSAELGYRIAQWAAGRGVATAAVRELCRLAASEFGLETVTARTTNENAASQRVLTKAGFFPSGPTQVGGRPGICFRRDLTSP
jgi:[ribosomal protein S5]-alanine N-acetyltransferase